MTIYGVFVLSKSGGLIFNYDHKLPKYELEKTFSFPLPFKLEYENNRLVNTFGQRDGIKVGHSLLSVNGIALNGKCLTDGRDVISLLEDSSSYPLSLKFGWPRPTTNEKIFLASMFYPLFAIASQLSPLAHSSGIEVLDTGSYRLHCLQTITGLKFLAISSVVGGVGGGTGAGTNWVVALLRRIHQLYADFALKNPFYSLEMPVRCELFDSGVRSALDQAERAHASSSA